MKTSSNADKKPFDDPRIITAMSKGFDRAAYAKNAFNGLTGNVLGPYPWVDWYDKEPDLGNAYKFDPTAAKQLLSAAGITGTLDIPFEYANYGQSLVDQIQFMAEQLKAIGINMQLSLLDVVAYQTKYVSGNAENGLVGFIGTSPRYAPLSALSIWHSSATPNRYHIKDPIIDSSLDKVTTSLDKNEQRAAFQAFENQLATRPYIMQVAEAPTHFFHSPKVHNYLPNEYHDVAGWGGNSFETLWMDA